MGKVASRYSVLRKRRNANVKLGFDYEGRILLSTTSNHFYGNPTMAGFAERLEAILDHWVHSIKSIKRAKNYIINKDSKAVF